LIGAPAAACYQDMRGMGRCAEEKNGEKYQSFPILTEMGLRKWKISCIMDGDIV